MDSPPIVASPVSLPGGGGSGPGSGSNGGTSSGPKPSYCTPNPVPNIPENNHVKLIDYRGAKIAAFTVEGRELICLPQAFELFLKHLVGGLHTVYTKLKRLEITPVVCNVEQVRILRSLGAIQPGVNRCKLIAPKEFDVLYEDCTNSSARPGRPPKRSSTASPDCHMSESMKRSHFEGLGPTRSTEMPTLPFRFPIGDEKKLLPPPPPPFGSGYYPTCPPHLGMLPFLPAFAAGSQVPLSPHSLASPAVTAAALYHQTRLLHPGMAALGAGGGPVHPPPTATSTGLHPHPANGHGPPHHPHQPPPHAVLHQMPLRLTPHRTLDLGSGKQTPLRDSPTDLLRNHLDNKLPSDSSGGCSDDGDGETTPNAMTTMIRRTANHQPTCSGATGISTSTSQTHQQQLSGGGPKELFLHTGPEVGQPRRVFKAIPRSPSLQDKRKNDMQSNGSGGPSIARESVSSSPSPMDGLRSLHGTEEEEEAAEEDVEDMEEEVENEEENGPCHRRHHHRASPVGGGPRCHSLELWSPPQRLSAAKGPRPEDGLLTSDENKNNICEPAVVVGGGGSSLSTTSEGAVVNLERCLVDIENLLRTVAENARVIERFHATAAYDLRSAVNSERQKINKIKQQLTEEKQRRTIFQKKWKKEKRLRLKLEELMTCLQSQSSQINSDKPTTGDTVEKPQDLSIHSSRTAVDKVAVE